MKKLVFSVVVAVAVIFVAIIFITKRAPHASRVAELLPQETIALVHLPDVGRTRERWPKTALYQIWHEPEVQAFFEKPLSKVPQRDEIKRRREQIRQIDPHEAFLAVTSIPENGTPKIIAGISYHGKKSDVDALLGDLRKAVQAEWPSGKSDIVKVGADEVETFTNANVTIAAAFKEDWLLVADDLDLMKATLARFDGKLSNGLRDNANFQSCVKHMPIDFDVLTFVQMSGISDRLVSFMMMANPGGDPHAFDELKKIQALVTMTKLDDANLRDAMFVLKPGEGKKETMGRGALSLTSTNTLVYYAAEMQKAQNFKMPNPALDQSGVLKMLQAYLDNFAAQGLTADDFYGAFGPELSVITDWLATSQTPAPIIALDLRDKAKAQRFVDAVTQPPNGQPWAKQVIDGTTYFQLPPTGFGFVQISATLAVSDKFVLAGLSFDAVKTALAQLNSKDVKLDKLPDFRKAADAVNAPTLAFSYVDAKTLFERIYGPLRPFAMMWTAFIKGSSDYVDVSKLPATETISKHLTPIVFSQSHVTDGVMSESVGPITMTQALVGFGAGAGAAIVPLLQKQMIQPPASASPAPPVFAPAPAVPAPSISTAPMQPPASTPSPEPQTTP